jgi:hypothetical protein
MTFYNVISGILFMGALQAFLGSLGTPVMWMAACLGVTILNESVITSELIEGNTQVPYTLDLKLLDFAAFAVLTWALLIINPTNNTFNVNVEASLWGAKVPWVFWGLLAIYWFLMLFWNKRAGQLVKTKWKPCFYLSMHLMWVPPLLAAVVNRSAADLSSAVIWPSFFVLAVVSAYLISKIWARN